MMIQPQLAEGWYYRVGAEVIGPISRRQLRERMASGEVCSHSLVWRERSPAGELLYPCRAYSAVRGKRLIVVLVGGLSSAAATLRPLLRRWGHDARLARSEREATHIARLSQPDAVFIDLDEAGRDGHSLAAELRSGANERPPVLIALTSDFTEEELRRAHQTAFEYYLEKPAEPNVLALILALVRQERCPD
jgi:CheY-like chemotaxis protein